MSPERWEQVKSLYDAALAAEAPVRVALLESADPEVRREVESLLKHESGSCPLDCGAISDVEMEMPAHLREGSYLGSYRIQGLLGRGGMGEVYRAHDKKLARDVAIKTLPEEFAQKPERLARFRREARALASLNHPNIATIHGLEELGGVNFLILELVEGETLAELLRRAGPLPVEEALRVGSQIAAALEAAHRKGITHRDIKPANIKLTLDGHVKVLDFGLAKVPRVETPGTADSHTETGRILGTPRYMSPEQARGRDIDQRTDTWAFGCVLYELLTGRHAMAGGTVSDIIVSILQREPDLSVLPEATPEQIRRLIQKCLAKSLDERPTDIADARHAIEDARERPRRRVFTRRRLVASGTVATAAAVAVALNAGRWFGGAPGIRSIAVLPLTNLSGKTEQEYFSDGLTDGLIADLAKISALKVISRTSAMTYKSTKKSRREVAGELNVDAVLEGSAQHSGDRIRVTAQLLDASTDQPVWADSYDWDFADVLLLQGEISRAIARRAGAPLTPQEQTRLASARTVDPAAHDAYLKGRFYTYRASPEDLDQAQRYFEFALERDPNYAVGYAGIARVWGARQQREYAPARETGPKLVAAAEKALALDNGLAEVHYTLGHLKAWKLWDFRGAEASFRRAIELNPNYPDARVFYARLLNILRRPSEAMPQIERALTLDPRNPFVRMMYAVDLCWVGRYDEAIAQARQAYAADPGQGGALQIAFAGKGMIKEAVEGEIAKAATRGDGQAAAVLRREYDQGRYRDAARSAAELLEARWRNGTFVPAMHIVALFQTAGLTDKVLEWLEKAADQHDPDVLGARLVLGGLPGLEDNPRFRAVLRRVGLP